MCTPSTIALASFATSAASSGLGFVAQQQAASAQADYQNQMAVATNQAANAAYQNQIAQEQARMQQEKAAASQQVDQANRDARKAAATARVASAEAGVSGLSVDSLLADFDRQRASNVQTTQTNYLWSLIQSQENMAAYRANAQSRIASSRPSPVAGPSLLATGLDIAGAGLNAAAYYNANKAP